MAKLEAGCFIVPKVGGKYNVLLNGDGVERARVAGANWREGTINLVIGNNGTSRVVDISCYERVFVPSLGQRVVVGVRRMKIGRGSF